MRMTLLSFSLLRLNDIAGIRWTRTRIFLKQLVLCALISQYEWESERSFHPDPLWCWIGWHHDGFSKLRSLLTCCFQVNTTIMYCFPALLSPPVLMHGGLSCITFCLSVCYWTKIHWTKIHISINVSPKVKGHMGQCSLHRSRVTLAKVKIRLPKKSRWAHINVKLLNF